MRPDATRNVSRAFVYEADINQDRFIVRVFVVDASLRFPFKILLLFSHFADIFYSIAEEHSRQTIINLYNYNDNTYLNRAFSKKASHAKQAFTKPASKNTVLPCHKVDNIVIQLYLLK